MPETVDDIQIGVSWALDMVKRQYQEMEIRCARLYQENEKLKEQIEANDDAKYLNTKLDEAATDVDKAKAEAANLRKELSDLREELKRGFRISAAEQCNIDQWIERHDLDKHGLGTLEDRLAAGGCIGGRYAYTFIPTSIGVIGTVRCSCGAEFTFQDI